MVAVCRENRSGAFPAKRFTKPRPVLKTGRLNNDDRIDAATDGRRTAIPPGVAAPAYRSHPRRRQPPRPQPAQPGHRWPPPRRHHRHHRAALCYGPQVVAVDFELRPGLLRHRDDFHLYGAPRFRPLWRRYLAVAPPVRRDDCRRHRGQKDGGTHPTALRTNARTQVGHRYGQLRHQRRPLLPFLFGSDGR